MFGGADGSFAKPSGRKGICRRARGILFCFFMLHPVNSSFAVLRPGPTGAPIYMALTIFKLTEAIVPNKPETTIQIGQSTAVMIVLAILAGYAAVSFAFFQMTISMMDTALVTNQRVNDLPCQG